MINQEQLLSIENAFENFLNEKYKQILKEAQMSTGQRSTLDHLGVMLNQIVIPTPWVKERMARLYLQEPHQRRRAVYKIRFINLFGYNEWYNTLGEVGGEFLEQDRERFKEVYNFSETDIPEFTYKVKEKTVPKGFAQNNPYTKEEYIVSAPLGGNHFKIDIYFKNLPESLKKPVKVGDKTIDPQRAFDLLDAHFQGEGRGYIGWARGTFTKDAVYCDEIQSDLLQRIRLLDDPQEIGGLTEELQHLFDRIQETDVRRASLEEEYRELSQRPEVTPDGKLAEECKLRIRELAQKRQQQTMTSEEQEEFTELNLLRQQLQRLPDLIKQQQTLKQSLVKEFQDKKQKLSRSETFEAGSKQFLADDLQFYSRPRPGNPFGDEERYPEFQHLQREMERILDRYFVEMAYNSVFKFAQSKGLDTVYVLDRQTIDKSGDIVAYARFYGPVARRLGGTLVPVEGTLGDFAYDSSGKWGKHKPGPSNYYKFDLNEIRIAELAQFVRFSFLDKKTQYRLAKMTTKYAAKCGRSLPAEVQLIADKYKRAVLLRKDIL